MKSPHKYIITFILTIFTATTFYGCDFFSNKEESKGTKTTNEVKVGKEVQEENKEITQKEVMIEEEEKVEKKPKLPKLPTEATKEIIYIDSRNFTAEPKKRYVFTIDNAKEIGEGCNEIDFIDVPENSIEYEIQKTWIESFEECVVVDTPLGIQLAFIPINTENPYAAFMLNNPDTDEATKEKVRKTLFESKKPVQIEFINNEYGLLWGNESPFNFEFKTIDIDYTERPFSILTNITDPDKAYETFKKRGFCTDIDPTSSPEEEGSYTVITNGSYEAVKRNFPECEGECMKREMCLGQYFNNTYFQFYYPSKDSDHPIIAPRLQREGAKGRTFLASYACIAKDIPIYNTSETKCIGNKPKPIPTSE